MGDDAAPRGGVSRHLIDVFGVQRVESVAFDGTLASIHRAKKSEIAEHHCIVQLC
jgi:hypothetical protein